MRYINLKTGAIVDSSFSISGDNWVLDTENNAANIEHVEQELPKEHLEDNTVKNIEEPQEKPTNKKSSSETEKISKEQIMQELDAFGIEYNPRDKKQVLYDLMMQHG